MWGYDLKRAGKEDELTQILWIHLPYKTKRRWQDGSPVESQRLSATAEDNALDRLEKAGSWSQEKSTRFFRPWSTT